MYFLHAWPPKKRRQLNHILQNSVSHLPPCNKMPVVKVSLGEKFRPNKRGIDANQLRESAGKHSVLANPEGRAGQGKGMQGRLARVACISSTFH